MLKFCLLIDYLLNVYGQTFLKKIHKDSFKKNENLLLQVSVSKIVF